ncbi:sensor histidine kinase [Paenibacillus lutimineralis]|uniref:histidine kinase n=1 Tax=Paenibacillus lutimineralis TaxID=2707005 RepID=A0A3Q9IF93_9BACL|nr:ATP-binding protein [Paenibacillus lutimineralis]AZS17822.1 HAMP domain-containing protein [Paenibacillus lutimineralis]
MNLKWVNTVRWKFLAIVLASLGLTAILLYLGYQLGVYLITVPPFTYYLNFIIVNYGSRMVMSIVGPILFIILYYLLTRTMIRRLENVNNSLQQMVAGNFDQELHISSHDEIGRIAHSISDLTLQLRTNLDKISSGLGQVANGQLDHRLLLEDDPSNEWMKLADSINRMAEQLDRSIQEERNAEKTKNDLITGVSHDLRTPLTLILGFLGVIENDRYHDEVELRHYVNIAYDKSLTLKKLVDELFEYTRINNGMPLHVEELDMVAFLRQLTEEFVPSLKKADMTCRISTELSSLMIEGDGDLLARGFENLISNAIRYGRKGEYVDIDISRSENYAMIKVINYGEPIPQSDLQFIFERFYRGDRSRSSGGTGLGLAIVKSIMEVHGGNISAKSDRSQTEFITRLPLPLSKATS